MLRHEPMCRGGHTSWGVSPSASATSRMSRVSRVTAHACAPIAGDRPTGCDASMSLPRERRRPITAGALTLAACTLTVGQKPDTRCSGPESLLPHV